MQSEKKNVNEKFISIKPKNKDLHKYIAYYYFHKHKGNNFERHFVFYPNTKNAITIYRNAKIIYHSSFSTTKPDAKTESSISYAGIQKSYKISKIIAPFDKIGIVFQPLGLNYFIDKNLCELISKTKDKSFNYFGNDFKNACKAVFDEKIPKKKVSLLDTFFEQKITRFHNENLIKSIEIIEQCKEKPSVQKIADKLNISRRTLLRSFQKNLCCSTKDYINIRQFRKAVNEYLTEKNTSRKLTDLAYKFGYYDQSEFNKHVKKITGKNPNHFFQNISHLGNENTFWKLKK